MDFLEHVGIEPIPATFQMDLPRDLSDDDCPGVGEIMSDLWAHIEQVSTLVNMTVGTSLSVIHSSAQNMRSDRQRRGRRCRRGRGGGHVNFCPPQFQPQTRPRRSTVRPRQRHVPCAP